MLSQKLSHRKSALMLEDATWFCKVIDYLENSKQCRETAKKHCGEMQPKFFYNISYAFLKALEAFY